MNFGKCLKINKNIFELVFLSTSLSIGSSLGINPGMGPILDFKWVTQGF